MRAVFFEQNQKKKGDDWQVHIKEKKTEDWVFFLDFVGQLRLQTWLDMNLNKGVSQSAEATGQKLVWIFSAKEISLLEGACNFNSS